MRGPLNRRAMQAGLVARVLLAANPAWSATAPEAPSAATMGFDAVVVRPLGLLATVLGTGLFVVSLPFAALGHNTDQIGKRLVVEPAQYTFARPLGDFETATPQD